MPDSDPRARAATAQLVHWVCSRTSYRILLFSKDTCLFQLQESLKGIHIASMWYEEAEERGDPLPGTTDSLHILQMMFENRPVPTLAKMACKPNQNNNKNTDIHFMNRLIAHVSQKDKITTSAPPLSAVFHDDATSQLSLNVSHSTTS